MTTTQKLSAPTQPKPWVELKDKEKIERMREIIKQNQLNQSNLMHQISDLKENFLSHLHKDDKIVTELQKHNHGFGECVGSPAKQDPDKVYF